MTGRVTRRVIALVHAACGVFIDPASIRRVASGWAASGTDPHGQTHLLEGLHRLSDCAHHGLFVEEPSLPSLHSYIVSARISPEADV